MNDFAKIYVFNLRGNQRTSGELSRKEGGKIFGSGSRTPVAITLLVKRAGYTGAAEILYRDIGDYLKREEKLAALNAFVTFANPEMGLVRLEPNEHGDWITTRNDAFQGFIPLDSEKKFDIKTKSVFVIHSYSVLTSRDSWIYNFSRNLLLNNVRKMINFYNSQIDREEPDYDATKISWSSSLLAYLQRGERILFDTKKIAKGLYRPFNKQYLYWGEKTIHRRGQFDDFFPTLDTKNMIIATCSIGDNKDFSCLISDCFVDLHCIGTAQSFPLYYYEQKAQTGKTAGPIGQIRLDGSTIEAELVRKNGISDFIHSAARARYGAAVKREDIFFYVYGYLHSPKYRTAFADDLKKSLPRIQLVEKPDDFWAFSKAGRGLAELH